jgi:hypothetical protein
MNRNLWTFRIGEIMKHIEACKIYSTLGFQSFSKNSNLSFASSKAVEKSGIQILQGSPGGIWE